MTGYTDTILKYATDNSRCGQLEQADGTGEVGLSAGELGHKLAVRFTIQVDHGLLKRARYKVFGCGFTIAACAVTAKLVEGQQLDEAALLDAADVDQSLGGLPEERSYCAELAVEALQAALTSVKENAAPVVTRCDPAPQDHGPLLGREDHVYTLLMNSQPGHGTQPEDRHLFACLIAAADREPAPLHQALGLDERELEKLAAILFPQVDPMRLFADAARKTSRPPEVNTELLGLLQSYVERRGNTLDDLLSSNLARAIAARAAHPGHLWVAMGLFERPQLSAAISRHLPLLQAANNKGMRWKRFLFKQLCEQNGGLMCKSPECGDCSDYALCFAED